MKRARVVVVVSLLASACHSGAPNHPRPGHGPGAPADLGAAFGVGGTSGGMQDLAGANAILPVTVTPDGDWAVTFVEPAWTFGGHIAAPLSHIVTAAGGDGLGPYQETSFDYNDNAPKTGYIRRYEAAPIVLFTVEAHAAAPNAAPFPVISKYPRLPHHLAYQTRLFAPYSFSALDGDSPWIYFDDRPDAFILSAASHFTNAATTIDGAGTISAGIDAGITTLPAGFTQRTILVAETGINAAFTRWGAALTTLSGKPRPANDATVELRQLGYWTDNGARYYYNYDMAKGYTGTIQAVRDYFKQIGFTLGYMQLDSWWYPKGSTAAWNARGAGQYTYTAEKTLFPNDLPPFQQALGLPLITHARWVDAASPYRTQYAMSNNVVIDPAYWNSTAKYLNAGGVITYEQDWLDAYALPRTDNLNDQDAFLDGMADGMAGQGIDLQYCMPLPRHYLQSTKYKNAISIRVNPDRFEPTKWLDFFYQSRLASAVGLWPWSDVFYSTEEGNLTLATLSAGLVGVGDAIGAVDGALLGRAVRSDGVIVKPDMPLVPLDQSYLDGARATGAPMLAATSSDTGGLRASYLFAFAAGTTQTFGFAPSDLGYGGRVRLYDFYRGQGRELAATERYAGTVQNGRAYFVIVPVGPSGIAFLGDPGKYASLGKQRIAAAHDDGQVHATVRFGAGEASVTLHGYAPRAPTVTAALGGAGAVAWDAGTQRFTVTVTQSGGKAEITIAP